MRKLKKSFTVFMACLMTAVMLCSSGCVIIVSDKWIEKGVETVKEIELKRFAMKFYKAGLVYGKMDDAYRVVARNDEGRRLEIPAMKNGLPVTEIGVRAFLGTDITMVEIGENVSYIGTYAFSMCKDLKKATFKEKVGWTVNGQIIDSSVLENKEKAAELLKKGYMWKRT